jgi:hypothetical protein
MEKKYQSSTQLNPNSEKNNKMLKPMTEDEAKKLHLSFSKPLNILRIRSTRGDKTAAKELTKLMNYRYTLLKSFGWNYWVDSNENWGYTKI